MGGQWISARRVRFQEIDTRGRPVGKPTYGVIVSDDYVSGYNDSFESLKEMNEAIARDGMVSLAEDTAVDFQVPNDHPLWKGPNYCGGKPNDEEDEESREEDA